MDLKIPRPEARGRRDLILKVHRDRQLETPRGHGRSSKSEESGRTGPQAGWLRRPEAVRAIVVRPGPGFKFNFCFKFLVSAPVPAPSLKPGFKSQVIFIMSPGPAGRHGPGIPAARAPAAGRARNLKRLGLWLRILGPSR
jgi:hypothetical protein